MSALNAYSFICVLTSVLYICFGKILKNYYRLPLHRFQLQFFKKYISKNRLWKGARFKLMSTQLYVHLRLGQIYDEYARMQRRPTSIEGQFCPELRTAGQNKQTQTTNVKNEDYIQAHSTVFLPSQTDHKKLGVEFYSS